MVNNKEYKDYLKFKGWDSLFSYNNIQSKQYEDIFKNINLKEKKVLEIGFGSGSLMKWMRDRGAEVSGVEIQDILIESAKNNQFKAYSSLDIIEDNNFNIVIGLDLFEHVHRKELTEFLNQISNLMKTKGLLIARFPNCQSPSGVFTQFGDPTHLSALSVPIFKHHTNESDLIFLNSFEGHSIQVYKDNVFVKKLKSIVRSICRMIVKIALGSGPSPLWSDVVVVFEKQEK